ncbi:Cation transporter HKT2 [Sesamum alatum]|uniref:Cation transporter HKT2 n=1 Tax=Sesamum alatum TaxID=300844 RepID=A0AAE1XPL2_9LAMI|nr:Cation transporter HKT2 [Sesamum alatum]KAK4415723.1 Cation transporter HKT2 [Sesamum alatum]
MSVLVRVNPFWIELGYSISLSLLGFLALKASEPRIVSSPFIPKDIDLFFTSTSVATVTGLSTIEMEFFSNSQLVFLTILMFVGGEAFYLHAWTWTCFDEGQDSAYTHSG